MQLTSHTDYALRLLIYLAVTPADHQATVQHAAKRYGISGNHLAKVAQTLVALGYIQSLRGRGGGLKLAHPASSINLGHVVRQVENLQLLECFGANSSCPIEPGCNLKRVLVKAQHAFLEVLDHYTLSDLTSNRDRIYNLLNVA
jgi:Rrf2 family nitric oxide-sensitive transcriptional repressor